jgi:hypothetical protein
MDTGDMFYIKHSSDNFSIIDCCLDDENKREIVGELRRKSSKKYNTITQNSVGDIVFCCDENKMYIYGSNEHYSVLARRSLRNNTMAM